MASYSVTQESFESLTPAWIDLCHQTKSAYPFILPMWLQSWWRELGDERARLYLCAIREGDTIIGIAPLALRGNKASFVGGPDTCDYLDFIIAPGHERDFFTTVLANLAEDKIESLELLPVRPDSTVITSLVKVSKELGFEVFLEPEDISLELDLPPTWDEYLGLLSSKQRHEIKRKLRRLEEAGDIEYQVLADGEVDEEYLNLFLRLFRESRIDKAEFMTDKMESFFKAIAKAMAEVGHLKLGVLKINASPVAAVMCFDYQDTVYLYNSGYDTQYSYLSVGTLSKVLCIQDSIQKGRGIFDFLRGAEEYKHHLGGKEVPLHRCHISLK